MPKNHHRSVCSTVFCVYGRSHEHTSHNRHVCAVWSKCLSVVDVLQHHHTHTVMSVISECIRSASHQFRVLWNCKYTQIAPYKYCIYGLVHSNQRWIIHEAHQFSLAARRAIITRHFIDYRFVFSSFNSFCLFVCIAPELNTPSTYVDERIRGFSFVLLWGLSCELIAFAHWFNSNYDQLGGQRIHSFTYRTLPHIFIIEVDTSALFPSNTNVILCAFDSLISNKQKFFIVCRLPILHIFIVIICTR